MGRFEVVPPFYETTFKHFARQVPIVPFSSDTLYTG